MDYEQERRDIVEIGRRLWTRGFVASNDGNISVKVAPDRLLMTPSGVSKYDMTVEMMVVTDLEGKVVSAPPGRRPSSEMLMHLVAYDKRPEIGAVVHAHPPIATGYAAMLCVKYQTTPRGIYKDHMDELRGLIGYKTAEDPR